MSATTFQTATISGSNVSRRRRNLTRKTFVNEGSNEDLQSLSTLSECGSVTNVDKKASKKKHNCPVRAQQNRYCNNHPYGSRLFISFSKPLTEEELRDLFESYGMLEKAFLFPGKHYGFAKFATVEAATGAVEGVNGKCVNGIQCRAVKANAQLSREAVKKDGPEGTDVYSGPAQMRSGDLTSFIQSESGAFVQRKGGSCVGSEEETTASSQATVVHGYRHEPYSMDAYVYYSSPCSSDSSDECSD